MKPLRKAILPVAGLGTRFLPATKSIPKEMLPVLDKPVIQYAVDEAIAAGIDTLIFITGRSKRAIADYFDRSPELENELIKKNKLEALEVVRSVIPDNVKCIYIRQNVPLGLGHAVYCAKDLINDDEPFAVILPDDLIDSPRRGCLEQMKELHARTQGSVIALQKVSQSEVEKYGIIGQDQSCTKNIKINQIIEKPTVENAPTNWAVVGRYILLPGVMSELEKTDLGAGGEIQLTDAISARLTKENFYGLNFTGTRFDCGNKKGFLEANVHYGLKAKDLK